MRIYGAALLGAAFFLSHAVLSAQDLPESVIRMIERQSEDGYGGHEALVEYLTELTEHPVDINRADRETLEGLPGMTPFMIVSLLEYREEFGAVASGAELALVDGFDMGKVRDLIPFISFGTVGTRRKMDLSGRALFRTRWNIRRDDEDADGLPVPLLTKIKASSGGRYGAGLTLESDAGEHTFPDFYSAFLSVRDISLSRDGCYVLKSAVVGDYSLRFGQGLVLWNGFSMSGLSSPSAVLRMEAGVRPYSSTDENGYFHGAGLTVAFPAGVEASVFYSDNGQDAKVDGHYFTTKPEDGLHDNAADIAAKDAMRERLAGVNVSWRGKWLKAGMTGAAYSYDRLDGRRKSYYNAHLRYDGWWGNASLDFMLSLRGTRIFGEAALDKDLDFAGIVGAVCPLLSDAELAVVYRYYSKDYIATHAGAYCRSNVNNEHGISAAVRWSPVRDVVLSSNAEYTYYPFARFGVREPSHSFRMSADCSWESGTGHSLYGKLIWSRDGGRQTSQARVRVEYEFMSPGGFGASTRAEGCWSGEVGGLIYQQAAYTARSGRFRCAVRATVFWTQGWDSRIYCYEGDVPGSFSVPAYYGKGAGLYVLLTYKPAVWLNLNLKCSLSGYEDRSKDALGLRFQLTVPF